MLIRWNRECVKVLPLVAITAEEKKIQVPRDQVTLLPGINELTDDEWALAKGHVKDSIDRKDIEVLDVKTPTSPGKPAKQVVTLKEAAPKDAKKLVAEATNPETLKRWLDTETREEIRLAITKRVEELGITLDGIEANLPDADGKEE